MEAGGGLDAHRSRIASAPNRSAPNRNLDTAGHCSFSCLQLRCPGPAQVLRAGESLQKASLAEAVRPLPEPAAQRGTHRDGGSGGGERGARPAVSPATAREGVEEGARAAAAMAAALATARPSREAGPGSAAAAAAAARHAFWETQPVMQFAEDRQASVRATGGFLRMRRDCSSRMTCRGGGRQLGVSV